MYSLTAKSVPHRFPFYGRHQRKRIPRNIFPQPQIGSKNWGRSMREEESKWRWNGLANGLASLFHYWIYILHNWRLLVMDPRDFKTPKQATLKLKNHSRFFIHYSCLHWFIQSEKFWQKWFSTLVALALLPFVFFSRTRHWWGNKCLAFTLIFPFKGHNV